MTDRLADYSQIVTVDQLDAALRAGGFTGVFHYLGDDFALREEDPLIVADIRSRGWAQAGIFVPTLGAVNGASDAKRQLSTYSYPRGSVAVLDIEPDEFKANPTGWAAAADGWCDQIRAGGLSPWVYGTDATVAACGNHADAIWRAVPGECDPEGPGLASTFFSGRRAIQCATATFNGVDFDVSVSEVGLAAGGTMVNLNPQDPAYVEVINREGGLIYGTTPPGGFATAGEMTLLLRQAAAQLGQLLGDENQTQAALTSLQAVITAQGTALAAVKTELDAIQTAIGNLSTLGGWTPAQQAEVDAMKAAFDRIEAAFKSA